MTTWEDAWADADQAELDRASKEDVFRIGFEAGYDQGYDDGRWDAERGCECNE